MEDTNFVLLWKEQYEKIDQSLAINKRLLQEVISQKAESAMRPLIRLKQRGIVALVVYLIVLGLLLAYAVLHYSSAANYFIASIGVIFLINIKALYDYMKHLAWAKRIDYNGSVMEIQQKLVELQLSILRHSRLMVLQFPFWTTCFLSNKWFPHSVGMGYIVFQFLLTGSFAYLSYWLYKNQTVENLDKKWLRILIEGSGGRSVMKALAFYKEMEVFRKDTL